MIEKTLADWLINKKHECFDNFPLGGKLPDLIAVKDRKLIAFELKKYAREIPKAMGQCLFYLNDANKVYIVIPKKEKDFLSTSVIKTLKDQGIGLIIADNNRLKILVNAKNFHKNNKLVIKKIKKRKVLTLRKKRENDIGGLIIEVLKEHPEGLTVVEISKYVGMTRHAVTKYIYQLLGEKKISQREVGTAKLCYLREKYGKK